MYMVVVGSLAYDSISTPAGSVERVLGGSGNYFSLSASRYSPVCVVGVIGEDYAETDLEMLRTRGIDVRGIEQTQGQTFHWKGAYENDMNEAITLSTELNVLESFNPQLPKNYRQASCVFLANIDPELQQRVLEQMDKPKIIACDTMNFWIASKKPALLKVLSRVNMLLINEGEAMELTGTTNAIAAAQAIRDLGPEVVVVKRGEYGFVLHTAERFFILPAFPIAKVVDPTGAGDTFAGGFMGTLARCGGDLSWKRLRQACVQGCLMASFTVQDFGVRAIRDLTPAQLQARQRAYLEVIAFDRDEQLLEGI